MDESRPRHIAVKPILYKNLKTPLIERSDLQSPQQRRLYGALTLAFWALWIYLWTPFLALVAWALGIQQAYKYMVVLNGYQEVLKLLGLYGLVILVLGGALILWAVYNIIRFSGVERRTEAQPVTIKDIGQYSNQSAESVAHWQQQKRLCISHLQNGHVDQVEILKGNTSESVLMPPLNPSMG